MASNKRTIYLGLDYTQFTGGLTEINRKMGLLDAEFKLATEQAKNYGSETDTLGLKQEYLTQKIALQNQKVEEAKKAYDEAMSSQNASQKEIDALDKKLLQERTTLEKLNGSLKTTDDEIKAADKDTKSFGDVIRDFSSTLGIKASPAVEGLAKKLDGVSAAAGKAVLAIGAVVGTLTKWAKESAETADELVTLSQKTGIATDELQKFKYASELIDVDMETLSGSLAKLTRSMDSARDGNEKTADAFKKLHVSVKDSHGELKNSQDVFYQVIDALGKIKNETERDALAMDIFGKSAMELNPLINAGSDALKAFGDEAERTGKIMSEEDIQSLAALDDAFYKFDASLASLKDNLALSVVPILTALFDALSAIPVPVLKTLIILGTVITTIVMVVKAIKSVTDTVDTIKKFFGGVDAATMKTTMIILGVVAALIALGVVIATIIGKSDDLTSTMSKVGTMTADVSNTVKKTQNSVNQTGRNATGVTDFAGGKTWVGEAGPELVSLPSGSSITPESQVGRSEFNTFYVTIDAKNVADFNRVVQLAQTQRMAERRFV